MIRQFMPTSNITNYLGVAYLFTLSWTGIYLFGTLPLPLIMASILIIFYLLTNKKSINKSNLIITLLFSSYLLISFLISLNITNESRHQVLLYFFPIIYFLASYILIKKMGIKKIVVIVELTFYFLTIVTVIEWIAFAYSEVILTANNMWLKSDYEAISFFGINRSRAFTSEPNHLAMFVLVSISIIYFYKKKLGFGVIVATGVLLFTTLSVSLLVGILLFWVLIQVKKNNLIEIASSLILLLFFVYLIPAESFSKLYLFADSQRYRDIVTGFKVIGNMEPINLLFGYGPGYLTQNYGGALSNMYIRVFIEIGGLGLLMILILIGLIIFYSNFYAFIIILLMFVHYLSISDVFLPYAWFSIAFTILYKFQKA